MNKLRKLIKLKKCRYCKSTLFLTIDHKIPKIKGGNDDVKNLQVLCQRCNGFKSSLTHKQVMGYFRWFLQIQRSRIENGAKPYELKWKK